MANEQTATVIVSPDDEPALLEPPTPDQLAAASAALPPLPSPP
jgi:hypothetical protein